LDLSLVLKIKFWHITLYWGFQGLTSLPLFGLLGHQGWLGFMDVQKGPTWFNNLCVKLALYNTKMNGKIHANNFNFSLFRMTFISK
jgi:hypothetical protein